MQLLWGLSVAFTLWLAIFAQADLPYNPTYVFLPGINGGRYGYVLEQPSPTTTQGRLLSFDTRTTLLSSGGSYSTISSSLPFLVQNSSHAYTPVLSTDGSIAVFTGDCSGSTGSSSNMWKFIPSSKGSGSWTQQSWTKNDGAARPQYLSAGFAFSTNATNDNGSIYTFGGMCPWAGSTTATWLSAASYSNRMLVFTPGTTMSYDLAALPTTKVPIAEAGFTITPLPSITVNSSTGYVSVQQQFLLLGGQSGNAFINMSNVGIFSLPQATWSFVSISPSSGKTDLMARLAASGVAPRSGHTAILGGDGTTVVVYGGWVGNLDTPASPQLAILDIGNGYPNSDSWSWSTPTTSGFNSTASGLYGHGALLLPGNIMMITGGYSIPGSDTSKRQSGPNPNVETLFFNISSNTWISSYEASMAQTSPTTTVSADASGLNSTAAKAGLGVGLVLGILAVFLAAYGGWLYSRKLKKNRRALENTLHEKTSGNTPEVAQGFMSRNSIDTANVVHPSDDSGGSLWARRIQVTDNILPWTSHDDSRGVCTENDGTGVRDANRTGVFLDLPSPQRGLRRPPPGRRNYRFDEYNNGFANAHITPIEERDEEDFVMAPLYPLDSELSAMGLAVSLPLNDPFMDPDSPVRDTPLQRPQHAYTALLGSKPPIVAAERHKEMDSWVRGWAAADAILPHPDRASPTKTDRTLSTLSDHSVISSPSYVTGPSRALSGRSIPVLRPTSQDSSSNSSPTTEYFTVDGSSTTRVPRPRINLKGNSFTAAYGDFSQFQAESEALLGSPSHIEPDIEPTFTRQRSPVRSRSRLGGWVGSVRRAIPASLRNSGRSTSMGAITGSPSIGSDGYYNRTGGLDDRSTASSPTKRHAELHSEILSPTDHILPPRRSVSDGANLLFNSKRGARDWNFDPKRISALTPLLSEPIQTIGPPVPRHNYVKKTDLSYRRPIGAPLVRRTRSIKHGRPTTMVSNDLLEDASDGDWDVEAAVQERNVQVMFTVPREKLRVVNAEERDLVSLSDGGKSRQGSEMSSSSNVTVRGNGGSAGNSRRGW